MSKKFYNVDHAVNVIKLFVVGKTEVKTNVGRTNVAGTNAGR